MSDRVPSNLFDLPESTNNPASRATQAGGFRQRVSRKGTVLLFVGLLVFGIGQIFAAAEAYLFASPPSLTTSFTQAELYEAISSTLTLIGILLVGTGWLLDQDAIGRATTGSGAFVRGRQWIIGVVVVILGIVCACLWAGFVAYLAFSDYYQVYVKLWNYTDTAFELILALAFFFFAVGWLLQHTARLARIEGRPL